MKVDQILKWVATAILIIGTAVNSLGFYPAGPIILAIGGIVWLTVSVMWREWALIVTNGVMTTVGIVGMLLVYFNGV